MLKCLQVTKHCADKNIKNLQIICKQKYLKFVKFLTSKNRNYTLSGFSKLK